ncbi:MAG: amidohydrolase family protein [Saprospiraceae bacterium]|nr:amidohydrolase family protein [Saprospiraceae bacterium]
MKKLIILIWLLAISWVLTGQNVPQVTAKIFIENVTLNTHPGSTPFVGNILVEDGIITNIGPSITPPFDARIIDGDTMHAYAGFIATLSHIGIKEPKEDNQRPKVDRTGYPPNDVAGITPEKSVSDLYIAKEGSIKEYRQQGFAIAQTVPYGKMLPGKGSVISLSGESFDDAVILKDNSMYARWANVRGVFPATLIGIMAKWREMYKNAELLADHAEHYKANPLNRQRPNPDAATEALYPVVSNQMAVYFEAEKHRDIYRTLRLQKDLGFDLVIAEAKDIDRIADKIKENNVRVLLSLDLPKEEKEEKKTSEKEKEGDNVMEGTAGEEEDPEEDKTDQEKDRLLKRKKEAAKRYVSQAKMLADENIPLAFSYIDVKPKDIHPNLRRMAKEGLSESVALSALTTEAATTLGIESIAGTLEAGKIGNLVVLTKPLLDEQAKVKMVVVDGKVHSYDVKEKKKKTSGEEVADVSGEWSYKIEVPGMTPSGTMTFTKSGDTYNLEVTSNQNPGESVSTEDIEIDGSNMMFSYSMDAGGMTITIENDITFDGNTFDGTVSVGDFGSFEITGKKVDPEN